MPEHRKDEIPGWMNGGLPRPLKLGLYVLDRFGVPTLILAMLFGMGAGWLPSPITLTHAAVQKISEKQDQSLKADSCTLKFLAAICHNTAKDDMQHANCNRLAEETIR